MSNISMVGGVGLRTDAPGAIARFSFTAFKRGAGADMFRKLGLEELLAGADSWPMLRGMVIAWNDPGKSRFVDAARCCDGVASSGERVLLHAICAAMDFAWLADELASGKASPARERNTSWRNMGNVSGRYRDALVACILAE